MTKVSEELIKLLESNPKLAARFHEILLIAENKGSELITTGNQAELSIIKQVRELGKETLEGWANSEATRVSNNVQTLSKVKRHSKKN